MIRVEKDDNIEEYKDIECDVFDASNMPDALDALNALNASDTTTTIEELENILNQQIISQTEREMEGKLAGNSGVLKVASRNAL